MLILRVCRKDGGSHNGFVWPLEVGAVVKAPDWNDKPECGGGLHGWLHGSGDHSCVDYWRKGGAQWLVVEAETFVDLGDKVKFPECVVRCVGGRKSATDYLWEHDKESRSLPVIGAHRADMRDGSIVIVGALGAASAGYRGTASAGYRGTASAGDCGAASAGYGGTASAGYRGTASAGDCGAASAGYSGAASAGYRGTASAGDWGTASAGDCGTASAGDCGTASAGYCGTASAGYRGAISILYFDGQRYLRKSGDIGKNGLKPNTKYRIENGQFVEVE